jgi:hypothetical protein
LLKIKVRRYCPILRNQHVSFSPSDGASRCHHLKVDRPVLSHLDLLELISLDALPRYKEQVDFSLLYPLIIETAKKATENDPKQMQTGPAVRGDQVLSHLDLLELISLDALPRYSDLPLLQALFAFALETIVLIWQSRL